MDAPQSPQQPQPMPASKEPTDRAILEFLAWRHDRLHTLFQFAIAGLIVLGLAIDMFLYKQMNLVRAQLPAQREAVIRYTMEFQKRDDITIRSFVAKLQQFAATNQDFRPILDAYRPHLSAYFLPVPQKGGAAAAQPPAKTNR